MNKVLFIEKLDFFTLILGILLRPFFRSVCFKDAIAIFQNFKLHKYLKIIGISWISFYKLDYEIYNKSHDLREFLEKKYIKNQVINNYFVKNFIKKYHLNDKQKEKLYLCIRQYFNSDHGHNPSVRSIILMRNFFPKNNFKVYYLPNHPSSYLISKELDEENISIIGVHAFFTFVFEYLTNFFRFFKFIFRKKIFNLKTEKIKKKELCQTKTPVYTFAFFPHKSLKYGDFFKKTYLYENNDNKSLPLKDKMITLFWEEPDQISRRYFRKYKIPYANIKNFSNKRLLFFNILKEIYSLILFRNLAIFISLKKLFFLFFFLRLKCKIIYSLNILNRINFLKAIYVHHDTLFPLYFLLACDIKKITTISAQEHPDHNIFFGPLCYNIYLISGQGFQDILKQRGYVCDQFIDIGLPRSQRIKETNKFLLKKLDKYIEIKKTNKLVVCFSIQTVGINKHSCDFTSSMYGEAGASTHSNIDFFNCILNLAQSFDDLYFVIRLKDSKVITQIPYELLLQINKKKNIEIHNNLKSINSYDLVGIADIIIGKQTSIMAESLSAGKKVIYYDNENYLSSLDFPLKKIDVIEKNIEGLKKRLRDIIDGNYDPSGKIKNLTNKYFCNGLNKNGFNLIREVIKQNLI